MIDYQVQDKKFSLNPNLPLEDAFMVAVDAVNHYLMEDAAAGELYAHPMLRQAWVTRLFLQYYTDLSVDSFEAEGRKPIYVLLQWAVENNVFDLDEVMRVCHGRFITMVQEVEDTMLQRYAQRNGVGNQVRLLLNLLQMKNESGNGGWDALRDVIAEHMLDDQVAQRNSGVVDLRLFGKMKETEKAP